MIRLQRVVRSVSLLAVLVGTVAAVAAPDPVAPAASAVEVTIGQIAEQLGVRVPNRGDEEFVLRTSFTGTLADTSKIQEFGIKGFRVGARVTVARIAPDRIYVEVDEIDPPQRKTVRLQMNANGTIVKPAKV